MAKTRRSNILINPKFQSRYTLFVCTWILTLATVFPMILMRLFEFFSVVTQTHCRPDAQGVLDVVRADTSQLLGMFLVVFVLVVVLTSLFMSHRIAGPVYKLGQAMENVIAGRPDQSLEFRKHDHFPEIAVQFNRMIAAIRSGPVQNQDGLRSVTLRVQAALEHSDEEGRQQLQAALAELQKLSPPK